jgi:tRNA pseudouridine32 synthase/23S rRNA pseudouridine746 synthase
MKDGVGPSRVGLPVGPWTTAIDFLVERFPAIPRTEWLTRMSRGDVRTSDGTLITPQTGYRPHTTIYYYRHLEVEPRIPFDEIVLFQDEYLVVADKPHFLPVAPTGRYVQETLLVRLKRRLGLDTLAPLHRIDRETAGLVLLAVVPSMRARYVDLFRQRAIRKSYEAIAPLRADLQLPATYRNRLVASESFMQMHAVEGESNAESAIALLEVQGDRARYGLTPITGKRHQLRAHMAALGIPIENDRLYPRILPAPNGRSELEAAYKKPLKLLAKRVEFIDPISGAMRRFESRQCLQW